jgi:hypothetical protein
MSIADRAKHQAVLYRRTGGAILLLVGLLAIGGGVYVYLTPPVEDLPVQETDVQEFESSVHHSAVVVNNTTLYDAGQRLQNQPRYLFNSTPVLNLSAVAVVPDDRAVNVTHRLLVVISVTVEEQLFFERQRVLAVDRATVRDGRLVVNATLNANQLQAEVRDIRNAVSGLGSVSTRLSLQTTYETESTRGKAYTGTLNSTSPVRFAQGGYWLQQSALSESVTESTTVGGGVRQQEPDLRLVAGLGLLGLLCIALAGIFTHWSASQVDPQELKKRIQHSQYSEWISEGDFPSEENKPYVYIVSLEDLVDVAIDTNKRVIYDSEIDIYAVPEGDIIYYHADDPRTVSTWLEL